jgi:hypothetical protein
LLLEDALVGERDLDRGVFRAVEPRGFASGELEDLRPFEVVALDVVGVVDGVGSVGVEEGGGRVSGNAAVKDDRAFDCYGS